MNVFYFFPLRLVSSFKPLWSKKLLDMISILLSLLRLVLCPIAWCSFENVPCALQNNVYFASCQGRVLYMSIKSIRSRVSSNATTSLLILCLEYLSIVDSGVLKSLTMTVLCSISFLKFSRIFLIHLDTPMLGAYMFTRVISPCWTSPLSII